MRQFGRLIYLAAVIAAIIATSVSASNAARSGSGGGGGGSARKGGRFGLKWSSPAEINGYLPVASGSALISTYVTTLSVDVSISQLNLPDGTPLTVTVYANSYRTGQPIEPLQAGVMTLSGRKAKFSSLGLWTTAPGELPYLTGVTISTQDGTVIAQGTP